MDKNISRISEYISQTGVTVRSFEAKAGITHGVISKAIGKLSDVSSEVLSKIIHAYPDLSAEWLLTGRGEMLKSDNSPHKEKEEVAITPLASSKCPERLIDKQSIPLYDIHAAAGIVQIFQGDHAYIPVDYITIPRAPRCDGAMYVSGDSMYPILKSGDIVMYSEIHDIDLYLQWGEMYIVGYGNEGDDVMTVIKYIQKTDDPTMVRLVSQNQNHADKDIPKSAIRVLARVKASIRFQAM